MSAQTPEGPRHYEAHDAVYARLLARGQAGWDSGPYEAYAMRDAMAEWGAASARLVPGARVFELGCGTGALACELAAVGCVVSAVDVSAHAIEWARGQACTRGLQVNFWVGDASEWLLASPQQDLVVDAHMLHCLVWPEDRGRLWRAVAGALAPKAEFWTETMLRPARSLAQHGRRMDAQGIVWGPAPNGVESPDVCVRDGQREWPERFLAADMPTIVGEANAVGLRLLEGRVIAPENAAAAPTLRARFGLS